LVRKIFASCFLSIITVISFVWLPVNSFAQIYTPVTSSLDGTLQEFFPPGNVTNNITVNTESDSILPANERINQELGQMITDQINRDTAQIGAEKVAQERGQKIQTLNSLDDRRQGEAVQRELAAEAATITSSLNPPFLKCDTSAGLWDAAISIIRGKVPLEKVINKLNGKDKLTVELITDLKTTDLSLLLINNDNPFVKGRILVGDEPKEDTFNYNIEQIDTVCHQASLKSKTKEIVSDRKEPAVIPDELRLNPIFAKCAAADTDFAKYRITGSSAELGKASNIDGKVDLTLKIFIDLKHPEAAALTPYVVRDDNAVIAARLIVDEGISNREKIFKFIPDDITTDCNGLNFLSSPTNIAGDDIVNPLHGFG
jgi:hypothetical protein